MVIDDYLYMCFTIAPLLDSGPDIPVNKIYEMYGINEISKNNPIIMRDRIYTSYNDYINDYNGYKNYETFIQAISNYTQPFLIHTTSMPIRFIPDLNDDIINFKENNKDKDVAHLIKFSSEHSNIWDNIDSFSDVFDGINVCIANKNVKLNRLEHYATHIETFV